MRLKQVSLSAATSVVAGLTTAVVGLTGPAALADSTASLPLAHYAHMVADPAHQHLFFSQGAGSGVHTLWTPEPDRFAGATDRPPSRRR
ncbi:hypothetical protein ABT215_08520 [Streptomyces sp900105755]|uniref:hypothetical protein n=1 Tax=Streptomyces sp. 900105755 TaxID=3154389 RepID=UPI00332409C2